MDIPGEKLKLSNVWTNFDEFEDLCLMSGKNSTKESLKNIRKTMFVNEIFTGDWHKLLNLIIYIFVHDSRIAKKFDYSQPFIKMNQEIFAKISDENRELTQGLYDKLKNNVHEKTEQVWDSPTTFYNQSHNIRLNKLIDSGNKNNIVTISGNLKDLDNFYCNFANTQTIHIRYSEGKYIDSTNIATGKKIHIRPFREIPIFINAKYFNILLDNLSFNSFAYLVKSFSGLDYITVPKNEGGRLVSFDETQAFYAHDKIDEIIKYLSSASEGFKNITFKYYMINYNKFGISRPDDAERIKLRTEEENAWGEKRSRFPLSPRAGTRSFLDHDKLD